MSLPTRRTVRRAASVSTARGSAPHGIAVDSTNVYWTNYGNGPPYNDGSVMTVPLGGGTPTTQASGLAAPWGITVDSTGVYCTDNKNPGYVYQFFIGGMGQGTTLASLQANPWGIAVDSTSVYWTDQGAGTVMKVTPK